MLDASLSRRKSMFVSAAIRAGFAWVNRGQEPRAWREVMSMTGVANAIRGCNLPILSPADFAEALSTQPLRKIAPELFEDDPIGSLIVLDWDELSDDVYVDGCSVITELLAKGDRGRGWLPSWTWLQRELVENEAFLAIKSVASDEEYVLRRKFVTDHSAGSAEDIADACGNLGIQPPVRYGPLPPERIYEGQYWWPCPTCRWPMRVSGMVVRCSYRAHRADYAVRSTDDNRPPRLRPRHHGVRRQPATQQLRLVGPQRTVCVELPVWRYIVVPGIEEVGLFNKWADEPLVTVRLWPDKDAYDVDFEIASLGWSLKIDLKDVASARILADAVTAKPLAAKTIVLPDHRGRGQLRELEELLPGYTVMLVKDVHRLVGKKLAQARRGR